MKKLLLSLLLPGLLFAQSFMLSNIPLPKTYIQDLDPYECDVYCMQEYLDKGMIFSFLAHATTKLSDAQLNEARVMFVSIFNLGSIHSGKQLKIAMLLPYKKIGKYASSTTNASFAYLMTKNHPFMLKSYKIESENIEDLKAALQQIQEDGFEYVIAPLTHEGAQNIVTINPALHIYFPTINKHDIDGASSFLTFGAIDYHAQSDLLLKEAYEPLVIFSDKSHTGKKLAAYQKEEFKHPTSILEDANSSSTFQDSFSIFSQLATQEENATQTPQKEKEVLTYYVSRRTTNIEHYLKENEKLQDSSIMINTPIIKTGMILSQITLYDVNKTNILSTQINYDPLLLSMTQYIDRKSMVVANSITEHNNVLIETNALLGNDIEYDWINYTTTIGMDYFYSLITDEARTYYTKVVNNQMVYDIELLKPARSKFIAYTRPTRERDIIEEDLLKETK